MLTQKQHTSHITERESSNVTLQKKDRNPYEKLNEEFLKREVSPRFLPQCQFDICSYQPSKLWPIEY